MEMLDPTPFDPTTLGGDQTPINEPTASIYGTPLARQITADPNQSILDALDAAGLLSNDSNLYS